MKTAPVAGSLLDLAPAKAISSARDWTHSFTPGRLLLLIAVFLFALYPEVILGSHSFFDRDFGLFTYPLVHYAREQIWQGHIPLWNPLSDCGVPFLAQWNTGVCYPLAWFYLLLPLPWSLNYFCIGHLVLAGWGMYLLARHWTANPFAATVAGLAYALNGFAMNCLMWTGCLAAYAWLPLTILYVSRGWREGGRAMLAGIMAATMQMLAGAPEFILVTWLMLGTLWLTDVKNVSFKSSTIRLSATGLLVAGLSAVQLLPFLQFVAHSDRSNAAGNTAWSMPLDGLANFLVPLFHCSKTILGSYIQVNQQWTTSYYVGISIVALAIIGAWKTRSKRVWWLAAAAVFGILMALGDHTFVYPLVKRAIPPFGLARYPIKFILSAIFALPLLAAFAVKWALTQEKRPLTRSLTTCGGVLLGLLILILAVGRAAPPSNEAWKATAISGLSRAGLLLLGLGIVFQIRTTSDASRKRWAGFALLALLGVDAITHTNRQNPTVQDAAYGPLAFDMKPMPRIGESRAMVSPRTQAILSRSSLPDPLVYYVGNRKSLFEDCNLIEGIPKVNGFSPIHLKEQAAVNGLVYQPTNYPSGLIDFMGVTQLSSDDDFWRWVPRNSALPLITGGQKAVFADQQETLAALASPAFNPHAVVYLPREALGKVSATNAALVEIQQTEFSANRISATATAEAPALIVISQNQYPAWKAFVDGHPTPLLRANHAFQAVEIPPGKHDLFLEYRDTSFHLGAAITTLSLLVCATLFIRAKRNLIPETTLSAH